MYSVPLRRALVTGTDLPYPEGVAAAEVLKVGAGRRRRGGEPPRARCLIGGATLVSAAYSLLAKTRLVADEAAQDLPRRLRRDRASRPACRMALIGVGHLVGLAVGMAMFVGMLISWVVIVPHWTTDCRASSPRPRTTSTISSATAFTQKVRIRRCRHDRRRRDLDLAQDHRADRRGYSRRRSPPTASARPAARASLPLTERDIPIGIVSGIILLSMIPIGLLLYAFGNTDPIAAEPGATIGTQHHLHPDRRRRDRRRLRLHGRPDRRVEQPDLRRRHPVRPRYLADPGASCSASVGGDATKALVAFALFVTAIIFGVATISNNNLQDLKTGQLVERDAVAAAGRAGARRGVRRARHPADARPPQHRLRLPRRARVPARTRSPRRRRRLISAIAQGVLGGSLDWGLIGIGAVIGVVAVIVDEVLRELEQAAAPAAARRRHGHLSADER